MDFEDELQQLIDRAIEDGITEDEIIGELEMAAQQIKDSLDAAPRS